METLFGTEHNITLAQECARAILVFFYGLTMLRLSGRRTFGKMSALDLIVSVIVGSSLSRALTGSAPLAGTLAAVAVLTLLHVALSYGVALSRAFSHLVEGKPVALGREGRVNDRQRRKYLISESDLEEALRGNGLDGLEAVDDTRSITLEPNGRINVLRR